MSGLDTSSILTCRTFNCGTKSNQDKDFNVKRCACSICWQEAIDVGNKRAILEEWNREDVQRKKDCEAKLRQGKLNIYVKTIYLANYSDLSRRNSKC